MAAIILWLAFKQLVPPLENQERERNSTRLNRRFNTAVAKWGFKFAIFLIFPLWFMHETRFWTVGETSSHFTSDYCLSAVRGTPGEQKADLEVSVGVTMQKLVRGLCEMWQVVDTKNTFYLIQQASDRINGEKSSGFKAQLNLFDSDVQIFNHFSAKCLNYACYAMNIQRPPSTGWNLAVVIEFSHWLICGTSPRHAPEM